MHVGPGTSGQFAQPCIWLANKQAPHFQTERRGEFYHHQPAWPVGGIETGGGRNGEDIYAHSGAPAASAKNCPPVPTVRFATIAAPQQHVALILPLKTQPELYR